MKKLNDEDIQKMLENGLLPNPGQTTSKQQEDIKTYQFLFKKLEQEPEMGLPYDFAAKVATTVDAKTKRSNTIQFYVLTIFITTGCLSLAYYMLHHFSGHMLTRVSTIIAPYKWIIGFVVFTLLAIQYADQKLLKRSTRMV